MTVASLMVFAAPMTVILTVVVASALVVPILASMAVVPARQLLMCWNENDTS